MNSWIKTILVLILVTYVLVGVFLFLFQERLIFRPENLSEDFVFRFESDFDEVNLEMEDGAVINALHFKAANPRGIILYFHGNAGSLERWGEVVEPFLKFEYDVFVIDYRGYGKSTGRRSKERMLNDAEMIYGHLTTKWGQDQIIVFGRSLGGAFACHVAGKFSPQRLILESPFYSVADVIRGLTRLYPIRAILKFNFQNEGPARNVNCPVAIFHGTNDLVVPIESGMKLDHVFRTSEFHAIEGGNHNDLANYKKYWDEIEAILN